MNWFPHLAPAGAYACYIAFPTGTTGHPADVWVDVMLVEDTSTSTTYINRAHTRTDDVNLTNIWDNVDSTRSESYWYDFSKIAGGNRMVISDARNWPAMGSRSLGGYQQKKVWMNDGAGRFLDIAMDQQREHRRLLLASEFFLQTCH